MISRNCSIMSNKLMISFQVFLVRNKRILGRPLDMKIGQRATEYFLKIPTLLSCEQGNSTENVARKFKIYVILNFQSLYGFHRSHDKKSKNLKNKFCCFLPYFYKYIYLNSIFVYHALQLHLRESKPNLCITLSKILRCS